MPAGESWEMAVQRKASFLHAPTEPPNRKLKSDSNASHVLFTAAVSYPSGHSGNLTPWMFQAVQAAMRTPARNHRRSRSSFRVALEVQVCNLVQTLP